jgi:two-component system alkaline phosphatase synthesis response regulator PhoP
MKLLIAEDDALIREGLRDILEAEGYQCFLAEDGAAALIAYQQEQPALILLDIMMPNKDGYAVCREIRRHDLHTAIIFISAKSEEIDRVLGLELGADDYIMKPFGKHEVIARVRAVIRRYLMANENTPQTQIEKGVPDDIFEMADLTINKLELRAQRQQQIIELSLRDCAILQLLCLHQNEVVSRDQLFNHCWGRDYLPDSRTLDQHISKLRKQVELDPKDPQLIKTVHGVGYRYEASKSSLT